MLVHDFDALASELKDILRQLNVLKNRTFRMQLNPMIHTLQILEYLENAYQAALEHLPSVKDRTEKSYFFSEELERHIFDNISTIFGYLNLELGDEAAHVKRREEYVSWKARLHDPDLCDLYGVIHLAKDLCENLSRRTQEDED